VKILFILAGQVFPFLSAISYDVTNIKISTTFAGRRQEQVFLSHYNCVGQTDTSRNIPKYCSKAKSEFEVYLLRGDCQPAAASGLYL
jgi:hypothetical protein